MTAYGLVSSAHFSFEQPAVSVRERLVEMTGTWVKLRLDSSESMLSSSAAWWRLRALFFLAGADMGLLHTRPYPLVIYCRMCLLGGRLNSGLLSALGRKILRLDSSWSCHQAFGSCEASVVGTVSTAIKHAGHMGAVVGIRRVSR